MPLKRACPDKFHKNVFFRSAESASAVNLENNVLPATGLVTGQKIPYPFCTCPFSKTGAFKGCNAAVNKRWALSKPNSVSLLKAYKYLAPHKYSRLPTKQWIVVSPPRAKRINSVIAPRSRSQPQYLSWVLHQTRRRTAKRN